ncbi:MAG: MarR family winged helix-turn-helix transcriptional regulator [Pedobacter sp.]
MARFDIEKSVGFMLSKAHQRLFSHLGEVLNPYGITAKQFALLAFLWKQDGLSQTELSERSEIDRTTLSGMVDRLEKAGLVQRDPSPEDRRAFLLRLTEQGAALESELSDLAFQVRRDLFSRFAEGEYEQLCMLLDKMRR